MQTSGAPEAVTGVGPHGASDAVSDGGSDGAFDGDGPVDPLTALAEALEGADELDADARIDLLTRVEATVADALRGLDGL